MRGFTLIEIVVMLAIITAVSSVVLFNFSGLNEGGALNRSARELALSIRRAQNMALAVTQIRTSGGALIPPAVGIKLSLAQPDKATLFADLNPGDKRYNADPLNGPVDALIGSAIEFPRGVKIKSLKDKNGVSYPAVHIIFTAPEAAVFLTDGNGADIGNDLFVVFGVPSNTLTRTVTIRTSGQVSIK